MNVKPAVGMYNRRYVGIVAAASTEAHVEHDGGLVFWDPDPTPHSAARRVAAAKDLACHSPGVRSSRSSMPLVPIASQRLTSRF